MNAANCVTHEDVIAHRAATTTDAWLRMPARVLGRVFDTIGLWQGRAVMRAHLLEMDDRLVRDIGLDRVQIRREATKPFWKP